MRIDRQNAKCVRKANSLMAWNRSEEYCIRGIEPPYRRRLRAEHTAACLEAQRRLRKEGRKYHEIEAIISNLSNRLSRKARRQAEAIAKYDAVSGYRQPTSLVDIINAAFSAMVIEA